jgi:hypothetical protein
MSDFYGTPTVCLSSGEIELECLETAGPRIVRLRYKGSPNLLVELPQNSIPTPYGVYHYMGGHRLWHAPEGMPGSYIPDNDGLTLSRLPDGVLLDGKPEVAIGIHKKIEVHLAPDQPRITLHHTLVNEGPLEVELAPWALTMFRLGGKVILPIQEREPKLKDLLPNRHLSFWPYSHIHDPRLHLDEGFIILDAQPHLPPIKIGTFNPQGWMAYWLEGILFRKSFAVQLNQAYPDLGCNAESYCDHEFVELESLGPLTRLAPGGQVTHTETWELYDHLEQDFIPDGLMSLLKAPGV